MSDDGPSWVRAVSLLCSSWMVNLMWFFRTRTKAARQNLRVDSLGMGKKGIHEQEDHPTVHHNIQIGVYT